MGKELKDKTDLVIIGVDIDDDALNIASQIYNEVIRIDLDKTIESLFKIDEKFDCIVFGDILEHLVRPEFLLRNAGGLLKNDGFIIASIPNIANWMIRMKLLFGNFNCDGGILNPQHLRFYTYKTAKKLLEDNGYRIISVINNNQTWLFRFLGRYWKKLFAFQFVFKCIKA